MTGSFVCMLPMYVSMQVCIQTCPLNVSQSQHRRHRLTFFVCFCVVSGSRLLQPAQVCDMLKGLILVLCFSMMHYVDYSMMYHLIRGQSVIKLYIIYNMLEVPAQLQHSHVTFTHRGPLMHFQYNCT